MEPKRRTKSQTPVCCLLFARRDTYIAIAVCKGRGGAAEMWWDYLR